MFLIFLDNFKNIKTLIVICYLIFGVKILFKYNYYAASNAARRDSRAAIVAACA